MKMSLEYFSRGKVLYFIIPECKPYNMVGHKRVIHFAMDITDKESIQFLKTQIKIRQRSAFLKTIVRTGIISPQVGVYLKHSDRIQEESERLSKKIDSEPEYLEDFTIIEFKENFVRRSRKASDYLKSSEGKEVQIILPEKDNSKEDNLPNDSKFKNQFGNVSDLSLNKEKEKTEESSENNEDLFELDNNPFEKTNKFKDKDIEDENEDEFENETKDKNDEEISNNSSQKNIENTDDTDEDDDPFDAFAGLLENN